MKKLLLFFVTFTSVFVLSACLTGGTGRDTVTDVNIPDELPTEQVNLIFWHAWGETNSNLVAEMFESFKAEYPELNVNLTQTGQGNYDSLRESLIHAIAAGATPTMMIGYPDHFAGYLNGNAIVPLDDFISHPEWGVDLDDFIEGYIEENSQFPDYIFSLPLSKSTEMAVYNKDVFDAHGYDFSNLTHALTWDDLEAMMEDIVAPSGMSDADRATNMQTRYMINIDSSSNFYINSSRQWGAGYTDTDGNILIDEDEGRTREMLEFFQARFADRTIVFPIEEGLDYGNELLHRGLVAITQGSTAGMQYNIPTASRTSNGIFGMFDIGVMPVIQKDSCELGADATDVPGTCSAMQQGPNIAISSDASDAERLVAWLFIKHMTNTENTAMFAMTTGYIPVRYSAFQSDDYQTFLDDMEDPFAMAARAAQAQINFYRFDAAFTGEVTSARARNEVGQALDALFTGDGVDTVINRLKSRLS